MIRRTLLLFTGIILFTTASCGWMPMPKLQVKIAGHPLTVRVAANEAHRERGLMNTETLPENEGMLFAYNEEQMMSFWMKDTHVPLDIAFFDSDRYLLNIEFMRPDQTKSIYSSASEAQYAVEVNRGWFLDRDIGVYDRLELPPEFDEIDVE